MLRIFSAMGLYIESSHLDNDSDNIMSRMGLYMFLGV